MPREMTITTHDEYVLVVPDGMTDDEATEWGEAEVANGHVDRNDGWTDVFFEDIGEEDDE